VGDKQVALHHHAGLVFHLAFHHVAVHALAGIVVVAQRLMQAMPHLAGDYGSGDELAVGMLLAGAGAAAMVLEDGKVVDAVIEAQRVIALLEYGEDSGHLGVGHQRHATGVIGILDDDFVKSETLHRAPQMLQAAGGLDQAGERGVFVGHNANRPRLAAIGGIARKFHRRFIFISRAEGASLHIPGDIHHRGSMGRQVLGALGAFGGDDDPFFGEEVLSQLWHRGPAILYRQIKARGAAACRLLSWCDAAAVADVEF
jgi:hypothetical protein